MAGHLWDAKRISSPVARRWLQAYGHARQHGANHDHAAIFASYRTEKDRRAGDNTARYSIPVSWAGEEVANLGTPYEIRRSINRPDYPKGPNAQNYANAAGKVLHHATAHDIAVTAGVPLHALMHHGGHRLDPDTPANIALDYLGDTVTDGDQHLAKIQQFYGAEGNYDPAFGASRYGTPPAGVGTLSARTRQAHEQSLAAHAAHETVAGHLPDHYAEHSGTTRNLSTHYSARAAEHAGLAAEHHSTMMAGYHHNIASSSHRTARREIPPDLAATPEGQSLTEAHAAADQTHYDLRNESRHLYGTPPVRPL